MRYGLFLPNFGPFFDPRVLGRLAGRAEDAGWDGIFLWDHILFSAERSWPVVDPWVAMAAIATGTTRIRFGALMTPVARRRPWKVARETVSLDHLSGGRLIFGAGLGYPPTDEFALFGEEPDDRVRAAKLDEGLDLITELWSGAEVERRGEHFTVGPVRFLPTPVQRPRIPVWIAAWWPNKAPLRRAARWDGVVSELVGGGLPTPGNVQDLLAYVRKHRVSDESFDVVLNGYRGTLDGSPGLLAEYADAGLTWWLERVDPDRAFSVAEAETVIRDGPPAG